MNDNVTVPASGRRRRALADLLDRMERAEGPLDSAGDEAEIQRFMRLLASTPPTP